MARGAAITFRPLVVAMQAIGLYRAYLMPGDVAFVKTLDRWTIFLPR